jgi:hypothetical protein
MQRLQPSARPSNGSAIGREVTWRAGAAVRVPVYTRQWAHLELTVELTERRSFVCGGRAGYSGLFVQWPAPADDG